MGYLSLEGYTPTEGRLVTGGEALGKNKTIDLPGRQYYIMNQVPVP